MTNYKKVIDFISNNAILGDHGAKILKSYIQESELYEAKTEIQITVEMLLKRIQIEIIKPDGDLSKVIKAMEFLFDRMYGKVAQATEEISNNEEAILDDIRLLQNTKGGYKIVDEETTRSLDDTEGLDG